MGEFQSVSLRRKVTMIAVQTVTPIIAIGHKCPAESSRKEESTAKPTMGAMKNVANL